MFYLKLFLKIPRTNNQIRASKVRLISEQGKNLGIFPIEKALQYSRERNLDLIEVTVNTSPPVCKVGNLGKYLYQQKKKEKQQKQKQKLGKIKGVRISLRISEHDLETKANLAKKFLQKGHKVKIEVYLKGREKTLANFARKKLDNLFQKIEKDTKIKEEKGIKKTPRGLEVIIAKR